MSKKYKIIVIVLVLSLFPVGCMVGPKYKKPEQLKSDSYRNERNLDSLASVTNLKWFDLFNDDVLKGLIQKGLENNYDLKIAVSRIEQFRAQLGYTKADLFPSFQYGATINSNEKYITPSTAGATMSWELDFWGKFRHENNAVKNELLATEEARKVVLSDIVANIAIAYFQMRNFDDQLEITKHTLETRQKYYEIISERFAKGYISEVDKVQIEQQVAIAEAAIPNIERQITYQENAIALLTGQLPTEIPRGKSNTELQIVSKIPLSIPSALLENRPDVKAAELRYAAANERIGVAQAMRFPSINLAAIAGFASADLSNLFLGSSYLQNASGGIAGPIFAFGKNKRRVEINRQQAEQYKFLYQKTYIDAVSEVEQSIQNVRTYQEEWKARNRQVQAALINYKLSHERYDSGYVSYLEVLDVETNLFNAQLSLAQLSERQLSSMIELYKALGGGWNL
ncbi:outer membrane protein, multidrug efflux system [Flavobacterium anhuiense]|uniref:Outer membrane protein, multidrug efflux system n=1 Tax=Flavobacterium anhuiense TaxID=459526 RepID=A0ABY0LC45_9FLAO|nr:efflux transporter outer membrane subunit [Flavobacterium anhuiense]SCX98184.1 outer membrane protein, multidrug efflux system [Flavobacterium anhuiense]